MTKQHSPQHNSTMLVQKETGEMEPFSSDKLCNSLITSGAPKDVAENICQIISEDIKPGMTTRKIWRNALSYLVREDIRASARYSLRRAMANLGPDGFAFERFVEVVLQAHGYTTKRNQMIKGASGLEHEIDVLAHKGNHICYLEAKYKNEYGLRTHVNDVMYSYARFMDILEGEQKRNSGKFNNQEFEVWLVTNTEFTSSAITFGEYKKMKLVGWDYPKNQSLEDMIATYKVYPLTILPSLVQNDRKAFMASGLMLAQDLIPYSQQDLTKKFGINEKRAASLVREVRELLK